MRPLVFWPHFMTSLTAKNTWAAQIEYNGCKEETKYKGIWWGILEMWEWLNELKHHEWYYKKLIKIL